MRRLSLSFAFLTLTSLTLAPAADAQTTGAVTEVFCPQATTNSTGEAGVLAAQGSGLAGDMLTLRADNLPPNVLGFALVSRLRGYHALPPGSQGNLCLDGWIGRIRKGAHRANAAGVLDLSIDTNDMPLGVVHHAVVSGETWFFQVVYRDRNPYHTWNFTEGLAVTFQ